MYRHFRGEDVSVIGIVQGSDLRPPIFYKGDLPKNLDCNTYTDIKQRLQENGAPHVDLSFAQELILSNDRKIYCGIHTELVGFKKPRIVSARGTLDVLVQNNEPTHIAAEFSKEGENLGFIKMGEYRTVQDYLQTIDEA